MAILEKNKIKLADDFALICDDIKVCGRREYAMLLKVRHKYQDRRDKEQQEIDKAAKNAEVKEVLDSDGEIDRELELTMKKVDKIKKRALKKEREI